MKTLDLNTTIEQLTRAGVRHGSRQVPRDTVFIVVRGMILAHTFPVSMSGADFAGLMRWYRAS
jgi:type I restriction enzyme S subunit